MKNRLKNQWGKWRNHHYFPHFFGGLVLILVILLFFLLTGEAHSLLRWLNPQT